MDSHESDLKLSNPSLEARSRHIRFSSTVAETFTLRRQLSESLVRAAEGFWKGRNMDIKSVQLPEKSADKPDSMIASLVAEGGTIWTTKFDSYKKTVTVNLFGDSDQTEVTVQLVLPGGLLSLHDREQAAALIESFYESLENWKA